jgi:hypothetical protein
MIAHRPPAGIAAELRLVQASSVILRTTHTNAVGRVMALVLLALVRARRGDPDHRVPLEEARALAAEPPRLFGQDFHHNNALSLWALHAWIWRHNPLGMFADYNPRVALCPGHGESD